MIFYCQYTVTLKYTQGARISYAPFKPHRMYFWACSHLLLVGTSSVKRASTDFVLTSQAKQTIPIENVSLREEILFPNGFFCPRQSQIVSQISRGQMQVTVKDETNEFAECSVEGYQQLSKELREVFGLPSEERLSLSQVSEILSCRQAHGLPLPEGIHQELADRVNKYHAWKWTTWYSSKVCFRTH